MKKSIATLVLLLAMTPAFCQENDAPENPGESFSLEGALAMFKKATTLEEFEQFINQEDNNVNNLDLNNDGDTDYVTVEDVKDGDNHVIILSALLGENEKQDVATINIEKKGNEQAELQIFGDEELYTENAIAEPFEVNEKVIEGKGPSISEVIPTPVVVNVWMWPSVRFIYAPGYRIWVSPIRWAFYPRWWKPWRPFRHVVFVGRCKVHHAYFHRTPVRRVVVAHRAYAPRRHHSTLVVKGRRGTTVIHKGRGGKVRAVHVGGGGRRK